jgi:hypothetical protein
MTRQKHTKKSLIDALTSFFRRARTSLYQPFAAHSEPPAPIAPVAAPTPITLRPTAKIIPFPPASHPTTPTPAMPHPAATTPFPASAHTLSASFNA